MSRPFVFCLVSALLGGLDLPIQVAAVSYPTGCRIRRVRMNRRKPRKKKPGSEPDPVVILPRAALKRASRDSDPELVGADR